jgi:hypothetical protein
MQAYLADIAESRRRLGEVGHAWGGSRRCPPRPGRGGGKTHGGLEHGTQQRGPA